MAGSWDDRELGWRGAGMTGSWDGGGAGIVGSWDSGELGQWLPSVQETDSARGWFSCLFKS